MVRAAYDIRAKDDSDVLAADAVHELDAVGLNEVAVEVGCVLVDALLP